jgi:hypothetical protein
LLGQLVRIRRICVKIEIIGEVVAVIGANLPGGTGI